MNNKSVPDQLSEIINYIYPLSNTKGSNGSIYSNAYNSPDYFDEKCISNDILNIDNTWWSVAPGNNRRDGFTAMLSYSNYEEGVVFQLKENLVPGEYYRLKFKVSVPDKNYLSNSKKDFYDLKNYTHRLKIMFSKYGENWYKGSKGELLEDLIGPIIIYPNFENKWIQYEIPFRVPESIGKYTPDNLKNIIFLNSLLNETNYSYLYLDDVYLIRVSPCNLSCIDSSAYKNIYWLGNIPNSNMINNNEISTWKLPVFNATDIKIRIFNSWGGKIYEQSYWDPNGLSINKTTNKYFPLEWGGTDIDGNSLQRGTYTCIINMRNCFSAKNEQFTITWFPLKKVTHIPDYLKWQVDTVVNCCIPELIINNRTYTIDTVERADKSIISANKDAVIVKKNVSLIYEAGESIILGSNWQIEKGVEFQAMMKYCSVSGGYIQQDKHTGNAMPGITNLNVVSIVNGVLFYPNPIIDNLQIQSSEDGILYVYDIQGIKLYQSEIHKGLNEVNYFKNSENKVFIIKLNNHVCKLLKIN
jgi:hypothetical protein